MKKTFCYLVIASLYFLTFCSKDNSHKTNEFIADKNEEITINIRNQKSKLIFTFPSLTNLNIKRVWKNFKITPKLKIGTIEDETFLYPGRIRTDEKENIYVLDFMDYSVKKFDKAGNFIEKYGKRGKGPGELTTPFDFDVTNDGKIAFLGLNDNKFIIFDQDNIKDIKSKLMPNRLCFVSPNEIVVFQIQDPINQSPFQKINIKKDIKTDYQNILSNESFGGKEFGMLPFLLGDIHRFKNDKLVYVSSILGYVVIYDKYGKIEKVFKLIDNIKESALSKREIRDDALEVPIVTFPREDEYLFNSSNVFGDNLFILSNQAKHKPNEYVIDVYSLLNGKYKHSLLLNRMDKIIEIFLTNDKICISKENTEVEVFDYSIIE